MKKLVQNEQENQNKKKHQKNLGQKQEENQNDSVQEEKQAAPKVPSPTLTAPNTVKECQETSVQQNTRAKKRKAIITQLKELKKARQEYCRTKREQEKEQLTSILQNVSKEIKTLQLKEKRSSDGNLYPEVSKTN